MKRRTVLSAMLGLQALGVAGLLLHEQQLQAIQMRPSFLARRSRSVYCTRMKRQHHIVDPHTGHLPTELAAVSVLAPTGLLADGLSTACMVLGAEKSLVLAAAWPEVDLMCITKAGLIHRSSGFPQAASTQPA